MVTVSEKAIRLNTKNTIEQRSLAKRR